MIKTLFFSPPGQQEQGLAAPVAERGHEGREKRQTLEDLFRPPIELMHKGTFHTVSHT